MKAQFTEQYSYITGGITAPSSQAWQEFKTQVPAEAGWKPEYLICHHALPVRLGAKTYVTEAVQVTFVLKSGRKLVSQLAFLTDGFLWGYAGEGPRGLATMLDDILTTYGLVKDDPNQPHEPLSRLMKFIAGQNRDQGLVMSFADLARTVQP